MARFRLTGAAVFMTSRGPAMYETGSEIEAAEMIDFRANPHMIALDAEAEALLKAECDRLRAEAKAFGTVIGFGATSTLPQ